MKRLLILLIFIATQLSWSLAQRLIVSNDVVDVGTTGYDVPVTATFELRNKSSKSLTISEVKADCGCTRAEWPKGAIAGGERFQITLTYDARMLGHFEKQAAVVYNGKDEPLWLTMKGVVDADYKDYSAQYPYNFGGLLAQVDNLEFDDVRKGDHPELVLKLLNNTTGSVTPNMLHLPAWLTAMAQPEVLAPGQQGTITLTLNSTLLGDYGLTQQSVYLGKALGEKVSAETEMPVSVVLLPDLTVFEGINRSQAPRLHLSADHLNLGDYGGKMHKSGTLMLTNTGATPLVVTSLQMFTGGMTVTLSKRDLKPGEQAKLKVKIDPERLSKERTKPRVLMITNDPEKPKVVININVK